MALIFGGRSGEHEISIRSAEAVKQVLDPNRYEVTPFFIAKDGRWSPRALTPEPSTNTDIDVVFPILHGTFGEDGSMQGLLELADLPYVGAGVLASAVSMDKAMTKLLCVQAGIPVVDHIVFERDALDGRLPGIPWDYPVFIKPANLGSSVGITKAKDARELKAALELAKQYDQKILLERGVKGREFECAVLEADPLFASVPCEIIPSQDFYTYEDKYILNQARIELPANLSDQQTAEIQRLAIECFKVVGCEGMARVDFLMETETGKIFVNEINTIPGFTSISMYPKMLEYSGIPYATLIDRLIELALKRAERKGRTQYSR